MITLSLSLTKSWSYTTIWLLFVIPSFGLSVDKHYKKCASWFRCGNQTDLNYPFWTSERKECGHPDFKVNCSGDLAELSISSVKFQILEMRYYLIRLARKDYHNNLCPQNPEKAKINSDVLPFSLHTPLSVLYYNCSDPVVNVPGFHIRELPCENDIGGRSYFVSSALHYWDRGILEKSSAWCERNVSIPVSRSALKIVLIRRLNLHTFGPPFKVLRPICLILKVKLPDSSLSDRLKIRKGKASCFSLYPAVLLFLFL